LLLPPIDSKGRVSVEEVQLAMGSGIANSINDKTKSKLSLPADIKNSFDQVLPDKPPSRQVTEYATVPAGGQSMEGDLLDR
jgi:hypothetical protein